MRKASIEAGFNDGMIRDWERKPDAIPSLEAIAALAPVIDLDPGTLAFGPSPKRKRNGAAVRSMQIIGEVAAGLWLDLEGSDHREYERYAIPFDPSYPEDAQYGLLVVGTSINKIAQPGDVLQCLDTGLSGAEPRQDDVVIVERRRGGQREVTAKKFRRKGQIIELLPDSTDRRWTEPFLIDPRKANEGEEVAIIAVVIGVYKSLRRK